MSLKVQTQINNHSTLVSIEISISCFEALGTIKQIFMIFLYYLFCATAQAQKEDSPPVTSNTPMSQSTEGISSVPPPSVLPPELTSPLPALGGVEIPSGSPPPPTSGFIPSHAAIAHSSPPKVWIRCFLVTMKLIFLRVHDWIVLDIESLFWGTLQLWSCTLLLLGLQLLQCDWCLHVVMQKFHAFYCHRMI